MLRAVTGDGTATLAGGSELKVDGKQCPAKRGWKLVLDKGGLTAAVPKGAAAKASFVDRDQERNRHGRPRRTVEGGVRASRKTKVRALAGVVRVAGKSAEAGTDGDDLAVEGDRLDVGELDGERLPEAPAVTREIEPVARRRRGRRRGRPRARRPRSPGGRPRPASRHVWPASCETTSGGRASTTTTTVEPAAAAQTTRGRPVSTC